MISPALVTSSSSSGLLKSPIQRVTGILNSGETSKVMPINQVDPANTILLYNNFMTNEPNQHGGNYTCAISLAGNNGVQFSRYPDSGVTSMTRGHVQVMECAPGILTYNQSFVVDLNNASTHTINLGQSLTRGSIIPHGRYRSSESPNNFASDHHMIYFSNSDEVTIKFGASWSGRLAFQVIEWSEDVVDSIENFKHFFSGGGSFSLATTVDNTRTAYFDGGNYLASTSSGGPREKTMQRYLSHSSSMVHCKPRYFTGPTSGEFTASVVQFKQGIVASTQYIEHQMTNSGDDYITINPVNPDKTILLWEGFSGAYTSPTAAMWFPTVSLFGPTSVYAQRSNGADWINVRLQVMELA